MGEPATDLNKRGASDEKASEMMELESRSCSHRGPLTEGCMWVVREGAVQTMRQA